MSYNVFNFSDPVQKLSQAAAQKTPGQDPKGNIQGATGKPATASALSQQEGASNTPLPGKSSQVMPEAPATPSIENPDQPGVKPTGETSGWKQRILAAGIANRLPDTGANRPDTPTPAEAKTAPDTDKGPGPIHPAHREPELPKPSVPTAGQPTVKTPNIAQPKAAIPKLKIPNLRPKRP